MRNQTNTFYPYVTCINFIVHHIYIYPETCQTTKMSSTEIERIKIYLAKETSSTCVDAQNVWLSDHFCLRLPNNTRNDTRFNWTCSIFPDVSYYTMQFTSNISVYLGPHCIYITKRCTRNFIPNQIEHKIKCYRCCYLFVFGKLIEQVWTSNNIVHFQAVHVFDLMLF